ncbi:hypothetical protein CLIB1423_30S00122 [[Candida] railenensis]|uniref:Uncharacterized protein n=1 Tax=[Candida] railenensis TaxID=45579 RepID=A0A9P0QV99_9ASCO|nr:hypothetical protein CLIB1423_30S00122 [[Candida] railenensis]
MGFVETGRSSKRLKNAPKTVSRKRISKSRQNSPSLTTTSSGARSRAHTSILERFPKEILFEIFLQVGLEDNSLPLLSKYFNGLFKIDLTLIGDFLKAYQGGRDAPQPEAPGLGFLLRCINHYIDTHNYSKGPRFSQLRRKLEKYKAKYESSGIRNDSVDSSVKESETWINCFEKTQLIPLELFKKRFITEAVVKCLPDGQVREIKDIPEWMEIRTSCIASCFKNLHEALKRALPERSSEELANIASEQFEQQQQESETGSGVVSGHADRSEDEKELVDFPSRFYSGQFTEEKFNLISYMSMKYKFRFRDVDKAMSYFIREVQNKDYNLQCLIYSLIDKIAALEEYTVQPIVEAFEILNNHGEQSDQASYWKIINVLVEGYYKAHSSDVRSDQDFHDEELWIYLREAERLDFLELVIKYTGERGHSKAVML